MTEFQQSVVNALDSLESPVTVFLNNCDNSVIAISSETIKLNSYCLELIKLLPNGAEVSHDTRIILIELGKTRKKASFEINKSLVDFTNNLSMYIAGKTNPSIKSSNIYRLAKHLIDRTGLTYTQLILSLNNEEEVIEQLLRMLLPTK